LKSILTKLVTQQLLHLNHLPFLVDDKREVNKTKDIGQKKELPLLDEAEVQILFSNKVIFNKCLLEINADINPSV